MKRSLKAGLGLSMLVALIVSALGAMSASAFTDGHFVSAFTTGETKLIATETTGSGHETTLSAYGLTVTCHKVGYSPKNVPTGGTTQEITATATYENCTSGSNVAHIRMNGCHYVFTSRTAPNHGTTHFLCPTGKKAEVEITGAGSLMKFGAQTPTLKGATYTNLPGTEGITANITTEGIHAECHGPCQLLGTNTTTAKLTGSVTVRGVRLPDELPVAISHT